MRPVVPLTNLINFPPALVRVGGLWLRPDQIHAFLGRYSKHVICRNASADYPYTLRGTGSAVRVDGQNVLCCCQHQFPDYIPDDISILHQPSERLVTGSKLIFPTKTPENRLDDFVDLCGMHFRPEDYSIPNFASEFFEVRREDLWPRGSTGLLLVFGYPTELQNVHDDPPKVDAVQVVTSGRHARRADTPGAHILELDEISIDPDGMSGGSVFHLGRDRSGFFIGFAGMVTRGSQLLRQLQFLEGGLVARMLRDYAHDLTAPLLGKSAALDGRIG